MGVSTINILILQNTIILIIFELSTSLSDSANRFQKGCWESRQAVQLLWFLGETAKMRLCGLKLSKHWKFLFSSSQHCLLPKLGAVSWFTENSSLQQLYASWQDVTPGSSSFSLCRQEFPGWFLLFFCRFSRCTALLLLPCGCIMVFLELFFFCCLLCAFGELTIKTQKSDKCILWWKCIHTLLYSERIFPIHV